MNLGSFLSAFALIVIVPTVIGAGFVFDFGKMKCFSKCLGSLIWSWLFGQLLLWCTFQIVAVTDIMRENVFSNIVLAFVIAQGVLFFISLFIGNIRFNRYRNLGPSSSFASEEDVIILRKPIVIWIIFGVVLLLQVVLYIVLAYREVDDSFYVAEAVEALSVDHLYDIIPTTGRTTEMDYRHSLEPFPIWIAYLSRMTGIHSAILSHVVLPCLLLPLTYGVYGLLGEKLLGKNRKILPLYMVLLELAVLFGYYSTRTPEKFLLTRIRQGKTTLAAFIIPAMFLCLLMMLEYIKNDKRIDFRIWIMLFSLTGAGCLCSSLGAFLCSLFVGISAILIAIMYKKFGHILPMLLCLMPCYCIVLLYLIKG